MDSSYPLRGK
jgi:hypothetical protein